MPALITAHAACVLACVPHDRLPDEPSRPTADEAHRFIEAAEKRLEALGKKAARTGWVQNNFITVDTQQIAADAQSDLAAAVTELARGARRFEGLQLPEDDARKLKLLKLQLAAPAPDNPGRARRAVEPGDLARRRIRQGQVLPRR